MDNQQYLVATQKNIKGVISLEGSKSISNRLLIMRAISGKHQQPIENLSPSDDTFILQKALMSTAEQVDVGAAGTTMRFLTAYFAVQEGQCRFLTGSERMLQRPIAQLVDALRQLGADISYLGQPGFPPLYIKGKKLSGGRLTIEAGISSQFISALLLIAPVLENGLHLTLAGDLVSGSYLQMTLHYLQKYGIVYQQTTPQEIYIAPAQNYVFTKAISDSHSLYRVEADWSAASYYYALAALSDEADITLQGLSYPSIQGDSAIVELMQHFGVTTHFYDHAIRLLKKQGAGISPAAPSGFNFIECPDIAQTVAVIMAGLRHNFVFEGIQTLRIKETDRSMALSTELQKMGVTFEPLNEQQWILDAHTAHFDLSAASLPLTIQTYHDHRMAMSFAALALLYGQKGLSIENPAVVSKSYPNFWRDLAQLGIVFTADRN